MPNETQSTITTWAQEVFGVASDVTLFCRFDDEVNELEGVLSEGVFTRKEISGELADCLIVLYQLAEVLGVNLLTAVEEKMAINRERKWRLNGDGTGQHV
jgi:NTP pyrophosphatase (non-canonical NTP hydrolase)